MDQATMWPSGLRVLVIDNNSSYLSVMEELLIKCSYKGNTSIICLLLTSRYRDY
jgi:two-component response regulator (ARR-B family)